VGDLTQYYRNLVPQHQDPQIFRGVTTGEQRKPGERAGHGDVCEAEEDER
jgi:hypothetical protein